MLLRRFEIRQSNVLSSGCAEPSAEQRLLTRATCSVTASDHEETGTKSILMLQYVEQRSFLAILLTQTA